MNLTKIALAVVAFGVSGAAFAGTYSPPACTSHAVTVPCEDTAWDLGFEVFWVDATANNQNYAYRTNASQNLYTYDNVSADYKFGFELNGSMHFATGNDLTIRWERAHNNQADSFEAHVNQGGETTSILTNLLVNGSTFFGADKAPINESIVKAKHSYEFDALNAEFGQHIDVGNDMDLRVHAGLQYARIDYVKSLRFDAVGTRAGGQTNGATIDNALEMESEIDAVGARVGADGAYYFGGGFSAVAHTSFSLLVGDIDSELRAFDDTAAAGTMASKQVVNFESDSVVIPAAMLKTGINYGTDLFDGHMSLEGGWRWEGYFQSMRFVPAAVADFENFTFSGPYLAVYYVS